LSARAFVVPIAVLTACVAGRPDIQAGLANDSGSPSLSGYALKGPVSGATVTA